MSDNNQKKLSISDWISFLSAEKNSNVSNHFSLSAFVIAAFALLYSAFHYTGLVYYFVGGAAILLVFYWLYVSVFGQRAKKAEKLLDGIMSGKEMDVLKIEEEWKEFLAEENRKKTKYNRQLSLRHKASVKSDMKEGVADSLPQQKDAPSQTASSQTENRKNRYKTLLHSWSYIITVVITVGLIIATAFLGISGIKTWEFAFKNAAATIGLCVTYYSFGKNHGNRRRLFVVMVAIWLFILGIFCELLGLL